MIAKLLKLFLLVMLSTGCSFDPSTTLEPVGPEGADAAPPAVSATLDGGVGIDARFEMPDASEPALSCNDMYGTASDFNLCEETSDSCRFYVRTNEDSCTNLCSSFGGACIDNYDGNCGSGIGSQGCNVVHFDQVCICSLP